MGVDPRKCMLTFSGIPYYPRSPRARDVFIVDIGHHLAMQCRYCGASSTFYSVAEHSVHVSNVVPPEHALQALLHDAPEAYVHDITRSLKYSWLMWGHRYLEHKNWLVIAERFGVPVTLHPSVKAADNAVLCAERLVLIPRHSIWEVDPADAAPIKILALPPKQAEQLFLARFYELTLGFPQPQLAFQPSRINPPSWNFGMCS